MKMKTRLLLIPILLLVTFASKVFAQEDPLDKVSWEFAIEQNGCEATIIGTATIVNHWHVYAANLPEGSFTLPTELIIEDSPNYKKIGGVKEPKPEIIHDEILNEDLYLHSGTIQFKQKIKIISSKNFTLKGSYSFQTCDETHCLPPYDDNFQLKVTGCEIKKEHESETVINENDKPDSLVENEILDSIVKPIKKAEKTTNSTLPENTIVKKTQNKSLVTIFFLAFLSGFAALLTPCVFPMIPMTVSFFTKQSKSKAQGIRNAVIYGVSIIVIYVLLGTVVTAIFGSDALNALSTNVYFNIFFFLLLIIFAISFMGAFEITLPNSWLNKADSASDKGGMIGIFFMAFTLALVSFSCTGPIVGTLLFQAAAIGGIGPVVGMLGFSLALALPFALFAAFPGWMNSLPKSGGWLNTVKVVLGFLELALAFKFLSNADLVMDWHFLERELFLAIWIGVFAVLAMYLFGFIQLPHDSPISSLSVGRTLLGTTVVIFIIYLVPGLWGAPLKMISGFPPPMQYSESPNGIGGSGSGHLATEEHIEGTHPGPQSIPVFHDLDKGLAYAKKVGKSAFLDFTGKACVNCRRMEEGVWGEPGVIEIMRNKVVIISLYVDDKRPLPLEEQEEVEVNGEMIKITTIGKKWSVFQSANYKTNTQPYYIMLGPNGEDLTNGSADYEHHGNVADFKGWLEEGLENYTKR
jgi:thiol:disulfide interchange protein DsbD